VRFLGLVAVAALAIVPVGAMADTPADPWVQWAQDLEHTVVHDLVGDPCDEAGPASAIAYDASLASFRAVNAPIEAFYAITNDALLHGQGPAWPADPTAHAPPMDGRQCSDPAGWGSGAALDIAEGALPAP
jgi:hypothetical protein